jgi:hypothetical protein
LLVPRGGRYQRVAAFREAVDEIGFKLALRCEPAPATPARTLG